MKYCTRILSLIISFALLIGVNQADAAASHTYKSANLCGVGVKYVTIDMNDKSIKPMVMNAQNQLCKTDSLANMAKNAGAFAAINGTYFQAYGGTPVPWGTIIKDGKFLHLGTNGAVAGITSSGRLIVDRLSYTVQGYVNGELKEIIWRINHPSTESSAITVFTPEYGMSVEVVPGAKGVVVTNGRVSSIETSSFNVPGNGFAILYNPSSASLVNEYYNIGDEVIYKVVVKTTFTNPGDWNDIKAGLGAGPSLIINGNITANGQAEGFGEAKINTNSSAHAFIGATAGGKIVIGNMASATLQKAAEACQSLGLQNAMCLDGGGSVALYYAPGGISTAGRNINNALAFTGSSNSSFTANNSLPASRAITAKPSTSILQVDGTNISVEAYNINGSNYFKLRDLAMALNGSEKQFQVLWDGTKNAISVLSNQPYSPTGGELTKSGTSKSTYASATSSVLYVNGSKASFNAYNINGNNYFKLRDLGQTMQFDVTWNESANTIIVTTQ